MINKIAQHLNSINREDLFPSNDHSNMVNSLPAVYAKFKLLRVGLDQIVYENRLQEAYDKIGSDLV